METINGYGAQFFPDQNVLARDLNTIDYTKTKIFRDFLRIATKTPGVLLDDPASDTALQVATVNGTTFSVNAGTALDPEGRLIQVPTIPTQISGSASQDPLYYPVRPARTELTTGITSAGTYYINLEYRIIKADQRFDDSGTGHYTRIYDSYEFTVTAARSTTGIVLARIIVDASGNIVADSDSTVDGYNNYALYDERPAWELHQGQFIAANATLVTHTTQLAEVLEKSIGFQFPQQGNAFFIRIPRDVYLTGLNVYCDGDANAAVQISVDAGPDANNLESVISTTGTGGNPPAWSEAVIESQYEYTSGILIKVSVGSVTGNVSSCTTQITYIRR